MVIQKMIFTLGFCYRLENCYFWRPPTSLTISLERSKKNWGWKHTSQNRKYWRRFFMLSVQIPIGDQLLHQSKSSGWIFFSILSITVFAVKKSFSSYEKFINSLAKNRSQVGNGTDGLVKKGWAQHQRFCNYDILHPNSSLVANMLTFCVSLH